MHKSYNQMHCFPWLTGKAAVNNSNGPCVQQNDKAIILMTRI